VKGVIITAIIITTRMEQVLGLLQCIGGNMYWLSKSGRLETIRHE
jgi:hypothetical protein